MIDARIAFYAPEIEKELEKLPAMVMASAFEAGLRPAAQVLKRRIEELTPQSSNTGSTKKWSRKTRTNRAGEPPLRELVRIKMIKPKHNIASALVGFAWPRGNKAYLVVPMKKATRKQVLWGKPTGKEVRKGDDFVRQAWDETKAEREAAFTAGVKKNVETKLRIWGANRA